MESHTSALIIARPGRLRDGLQAVLAAMPQIETVDRADDLRSALRMAAERRPALVLLNTDLINGQTRETLEQIRARWSGARCIVLADDVQQQQRARAVGVDEVLLRGFSATELFASVDRLLRQQRETGGQQEGKEKHR
jgi:DNA-binding NarL/FixJ family response regulator